MAKRGQLTPSIQEKAKAFLGREITQTELRLYPYVHHCSINNRKLDPEKINNEDRSIIRLWKNDGLFEGGISEDSINMPREFFNFLNDMLWEAYFVYDSYET